jgi:6-phosphogluconate dehydrogenase
MSKPKAESAKGTAQFGVVGLGVMGQNLALNIERNGYATAVWNREPDWTREFIRNKAEGKQITAAGSIEALVQSLQRPRRILMMVKAGDPVDWTIDLLKPHLE